MMRLVFLRRWPPPSRRAPSPGAFLCTTPAHDHAGAETPPPSEPSETFDRARLCHLITRQDWSELIALTGDTPPTHLLQLILDAPSDVPTAAAAEAALGYFRWSERQPGASPHGLDLHCRLLHLLAAAERYKDIKAQVHSLVGAGRHSNASIFDVLSASGMCRDRSSFVVDILVRVYAGRSDAFLALEAFDLARDHGYRLSLLSCNSLLRALAKGPPAEFVERVYKEMIGRRIEPNLITFNTVINRLCKARKFERAADLVEDMKSRGLSPSLVTFDTLIDGFRKAGNCSGALKVFEQMKQSVVSPTVFTFNTLVSMFSEQGKIDDAMGMLEEMRKSGVDPNVVTYDAILKGYCKKGMLAEAKGFLNDVIEVNQYASTVTYNILMDAYCKKGMLAEAKGFLNDVIEVNQYVSTETYNILMDAYCRLGKMEDAMGLHGVMLHRSFGPDISTYNSLILGFCRSGNMEGASKILDEMKERNVEVDLVAYDVLTGASCSEEVRKKAFELLGEIAITFLQLRKLEREAETRGRDLRQRFLESVKKNCRRSEDGTYYILADDE